MRVTDCYFFLSLKKLFSFQKFKVTPNFIREMSPHAASRCDEMKFQDYFFEENH